jgi:hypothetical protein
VLEIGDFHGYDKNSFQEIRHAKNVNLFRVIVNLFRFNRTNWKAVALCFLAASVFWLFNAFNKNYATNIRFPLQFEFDRSKYIQARPLPRDIYLNVSGIGWDLVRKSLGVKLPVIIIPLERPVDIRKIVGSTMPPLLAGQIGNLRINHVVTDTLYLLIEPKDSGRFKLVVDPRKISFREGYGRISPIVVLPDSARLDGPKSMLNNLADSILLDLPERKISGNFREQIEIVVPNESIKRNPPVVEVIFEVGEIVEVKKKIKFDLINTGTANLSQDTDSILCLIQIPKNKIQDFQQIPGVRATIDLKGIKKGDHKILPVIIGLPTYAQLLEADSLQLKLY